MSYLNQMTVACLFVFQMFCKDLLTTSAHVSGCFHVTTEMPSYSLSKQVQIFTRAWTQDFSCKFS